MTSRAKLLEARAEVSLVLRASEAWEASYRKDKATFGRLLREEVALEQDMAEYLRDLSERAPEFVRWTEVIQAAAVPPAGDEIWKQEQQRAYVITYGHISELVVIGGQAGEVIYKTPIGFGPNTPYVLDAAGKHTAELVSRITDTTRDLIRQAIKTGIDMGENGAQMTERLRGVLNDPARAELIARTESVNAYQLGLAEFGRISGAKSKTWEYLAGACEVCTSALALNDDGTVGIDESFASSTGTIDRPPAHPRCRCGVIYNY